MKVVTTDGLKYFYDNIKSQINGSGNNTTYTLSKSGSTIKLTGSDGSVSSVTDSTGSSYSNATTSSSGLMSATDKQKLDKLGIPIISDYLSADTFWNIVSYTYMDVSTDKTSFTSTNLNVNSSTSQAVLKFTADGCVRVAWHIITESGYDKVTIALSGSRTETICNGISGTVTNDTKIVVKANDTLTISYVKDSSTSASGEVVNVLVEPYIGFEDLTAIANELAEIRRLKSFAMSYASTKLTTSADAWADMAVYLGNFKKSAGSYYSSSTSTANGYGIRIGEGITCVEVQGWITVDWSTNVAGIPSLEVQVCKNGYPIEVVGFGEYRRGDNVTNSVTTYTPKMPLEVTTGDILTLVFRSNTTGTWTLYSSYGVPSCGLYVKTLY